MAVVTVVKTIGTTGTFSTPQLWEDGAPADLTSAEQSAAGTFLVASFIQGESLTFIGGGATGKFLHTDSTGPGTGTFITYGITAGNPAISDVVTGGTSGATCVLSSGTATFVGVLWEGQCQNQTFTVAGTVLTIAGHINNSTAYAHCTTVAGASFMDHVNVQTNALRYNTANGAAFDDTSVTGRTVHINILGGARISRLQVTASNTDGRAIFCDGDTSEVRDCIFDGRYTPGSSANSVAASGDPFTWINCLVIQRASAAQSIFGSSTGSILRNCTLVASDDLGTAPAQVILCGGGTVTVQNCALFAGDSTKAIITGGTPTFTTCYSDISGTAGVTQTTYGTAFENVTNAAGDFRLATGSALIDTGTTDASNVPTDIAGTARPQGSAYDVGAWELVSSAATFIWAETLE